MQRSSFNYLKRLLRSGGGGGGGDGGVGNGGGVRWYRRSEYEVKVGVSEFLRGIGRGVEGHVAKIEAEIGDVNKLLQTRTLRLKKLGIPCNHVWILFALSFFTRISIPRWSDQIYYLCLCWCRESWSWVMHTSIDLAFGSLLLNLTNPSFCFHLWMLLIVLFAHSFIS